MTWTARILAVLVLPISMQLIDDYAAAQSKIPGAPSNAPPRVTDVTKKADDIGDQVGAFFDNVSMLDNYLREQKISDRLTTYLMGSGAQPVNGIVHLFYVQALVDDNQNVELKNFQYLTASDNFENALRESFTLGHAPGTEDRIDPTHGGRRLVGLYVEAVGRDGRFEVHGETLDKEYYQKIRQQGLVLRDKRASERAEAQRIAALRQKRIAAHAAGDGAARQQFVNAMRVGRPLPGPALKIDPIGPPVDGPPTNLPPTRSGEQSTMDPPSSAPPVAPPPIQFDQPPPAPPPEAGPVIPGKT